MSDVTDVRLPADQSEGSTHEGGHWLKGVEDPVRKDEPLLEVITNKVTVEVAAPADGVLAEILKQPGEPIERGEVLGRIRAGAPTQAKVATPAARVAAPPDRPASRPPELSPAVRRLIQEQGLDPAQITGTGVGGRGTVQDVEAYLSRTSHGPTVRPPDH